MKNLEIHTGIKSVASSLPVHEIRLASTDDGETMSNIAGIN